MAAIRQTIFEMHNIESTFRIAFYISLQLVPKWQQLSVGSGTVLASNRRHAITRTNMEHVPWGPMESQGHDGFSRSPGARLTKT